MGSPAPVRLVLVLGVASPDHSAVAVGAVPDLRAVPAAAAPALNLGGENGASAVALRPAPQVDEVLHPVEHLRLNDGGMAVLHIVLRDCAVVLDAFFGEVVGGIAFLEQGAALVFFIRQNGFDRPAVPDIVSGGAFDAQFRQLLCDGGEGKPCEELSVDDSHRVGFLLVDDQFSALTPVVAEEAAEGNHGLAVCETLVPAPGDVEGNAPAFLLRQRGHDRNQQFPIERLFDKITFCTLKGRFFTLQGALLIDSAPKAEKRQKKVKNGLTNQRKGISFNDLSLAANGRLGERRENAMQHDFKYISKRDSQVAAAYDDLMLLLQEVRKELKGHYTFDHRVVGSYARNMITYDSKSNVGFDFDVNIYPNDDGMEPRQIKLLFKKALDKHVKAHGFDYAEDSTRVLTIKVKDKKHARIVYGVDFAFVNNYTDDEGYDRQEYIHLNKKQGSYTWEDQADGYTYMNENRLLAYIDDSLDEMIRNHYIYEDLRKPYRKFKKMDREMRQLVYDLAYHSLNHDYYHESQPETV